MKVDLSLEDNLSVPFSCPLDRLSHPRWQSWITFSIAFSSLLDIASLNRGVKRAMRTSFVKLEGGK